MGKVANSQVGVYLGYASRKGHSFLDAGLFLPEKWFDESYQDLRRACGVPEEISQQTKPEIALELLKKLLNDEIKSRTNCTVMRPLFGTESLHWASGTLQKYAAQRACGWNAPRFGFRPGKVGAGAPRACA